MSARSDDRCLGPTLGVVRQQASLYSLVVVRIVPARLRQQVVPPTANHLNQLQNWEASEASSQSILQPATIADQCSPPYREFRSSTGRRTQPGNGFESFESTGFVAGVEGAAFSADSRGRRGDGASDRKEAGRARNRANASRRDHAWPQWPLPKALGLSRQTAHHQCLGQLVRTMQTGDGVVGKARLAGTCCAFLHYRHLNRRLSR